MKKATRLMKAVPTYINKHGKDPTPLIYQEHMSDEASGPEDDEESQDDWKFRMARVSGILVPTDEAIGRLKFLEVVEPGWRSREVCGTIKTMGLSYNILLRSYQPFFTS